MIATVCGEIGPEDLGKTLMHEHLVCAMGGWELDVDAPGPDRRSLVAMCVDRVQELQAHGYRSMVDPCPNDLGRDLDLMGEVSARTGFNIIAATGLYSEHMGTNAYWRIKSRLSDDFVDRLADLMIAELKTGARNGVRAGVIKLATGTGGITDYERKVFAAGARAALATGAPITTHTEGVLGDAQLALLASHGVPAHRVIIGHSCQSTDHGCLDGLVAAGAWLGFDRFGIEDICSDEQRVASLLRLWRAGAGPQLILSQDTVWCLRGAMLPSAMMVRINSTHEPLRIERSILPRLREAGLGDADFDALLIGNPRRYFAGPSHA